MLVLQKFTDSQNPQGEKGYKRDQKGLQTLKERLISVLVTGDTFVVAFKTDHEWNRNLMGEGQDAEIEDTARVQTRPRKV